MSWPINLRTRQNLGRPLDPSDFDYNVKLIRDAAHELNSRLTVAEGSITGILDGSIIVGNADKLDNFDASKTPTTEQIPVINDNGDIILPESTSSQLVVGSSEYHNRRFYVDAISGNDSNVGSSSEPLQTIQEAIKRIPISGNGIIVLASDVTIDSSIIIGDKNVWFTGSGSIYVNSGVTAFQVASPSVLRFECSATLADNTSVLVQTHYQASGSTIYFVTGTINVANGILVKITETSVNLIFSSAIVIHNAANNMLTLDNGTMNLIAQGSLYSDAGSTAITDWNNVITGIQKDANGVPRNVLCNLVL